MILKENNLSLGKENEQLEFKKSTSELKEGIVSLSSMLNKHGFGIVYFGVKDDGEVIGQQIGKMTLRDISQQIANNLKPQCIPTINIEKFLNFEIIKVVVSGIDKPYAAYGKYYMRSADEDRELNPNQLRELMLSNFDNSIIDVESRNQYLNFNQLKTLYFEKGLSLSVDSFKNNLKLITKNGKYNILAELLADENDYSIKVVRFKGVDKTELIERNEYGFKCLLISMDQVLTYVESLNIKYINITSHEREEMSLFDMMCFREAWINACLHNKWLKGTPPIVNLFDDRIEIVSTGGLPMGYSIEEFFMGISNPVNIELQKVMGQLNYVEQTGHGVPLIVKRYGKEAFRIGKNFIIVTLPFSRKLNYNINVLIDKDKLNLSSKKILDILLENPYVTTLELINKTGLSESRIYKIIYNLKEKRIIERVGSRKKGYWKII